MQFKLRVSHLKMSRESLQKAMFLKFFTVSKALSYNRTYFSLSGLWFLFNKCAG